MYQKPMPCSLRMLGGNRETGQGTEGSVSQSVAILGYLYTPLACRRGVGRG